MARLATPQYAVRQYQPEDEEQVLGLLRQSLGESPILQRTSDLWRWKHQASPFGPSYIRVASDDAGQVVGMRAFLRWEFRLGDRPVRAVRAVDTATHPGYRRMGIFSTLTRQVLADVTSDGVDLVFNTPNNDVLPGYLKLGWHYVATVRPMVKVLHYPRFAVGLLRSQLGKPSPRRYEPAEFFRSGAPPVAALLERRDALERLVHRERQWQAADSGAGIRTARSWDYLRWRYGQHPTIPYWAVFAERNGDLEGCAIFRANTRHGLKEVVVCELLLAEPRPEVARALLEQIRACVSADYLIAFFPAGSLYRQTLERRGFRVIPRSGMNFTVRKLDTDLPRDPQQFGSWDLALGDLEFF